MAMIKEKLLKKGISLTGLLITIALVAFIFFILLPALKMAKEYGRITACASNQKQIALAIQMYAQEHDGTMPQTVNFWSDIGTSGKILKCPSDNTKVINSYGQNSSINGLKIKKIDDPIETILTADASPDDGNILSIENGDPRHGGYIIVSYLDGHIGRLGSTKDFPSSIEARSNTISNGETETKP